MLRKNEKYTKANITALKVENLISEKIKCPICNSSMRKCKEGMRWKDCVCENMHYFEIKSKALSMLSDKKKEINENPLIYFNCGDTKNFEDISGIIFYIYKLDNVSNLKFHIMLGFIPRKKILIITTKRGEHRIVQKYRFLLKNTFKEVPQELRVFD